MMHLARPSKPKSDKTKVKSERVKCVSVIVLAFWCPGPKRGGQLRSLLQLGVPAFLKCEEWLAVRKAGVPAI